jgi:hypothetical protein
MAGSNDVSVKCKLLATILSKDFISIRLIGAQ